MNNEIIKLLEAIKDSPLESDNDKVTGLVNGRRVTVCRYLKFDSQTALPTCDYKVLVDDKYANYGMSGGFLSDDEQVKIYKLFNQIDTLVWAKDGAARDEACEFINSIVGNYVDDEETPTNATDRLLKRLESKFLDQLDHHCELYKKIGSGSSESPKWFQYRGVEDGKLKFINSQKSDIYFTVDMDDFTDYEKRMVDELYDKVYKYFREVKYNYIAERHPTITEGGLQ